jgi:hypothetical protein
MNPSRPVALLTMVVVLLLALATGRYLSSIPPKPPFPTLRVPSPAARATMCSKDHPTATLSAG